MAVKVERQDYSSHIEYVRALGQSLADDVKAISKRSGIRPQCVVDVMFAVMCQETTRMGRDRRAQSN